MTEPQGRWLPTPALGTAVGAVSLLCLLAVLLARPDLLEIALPLLIGTLLPLLSRAYRSPTVKVQAGAMTLFEGESTALVQEISSGEPLDVVRLRPVIHGWLRLRDGDGDVCVSVAPGQPVTLTHRLTSTRWGRGRIDGVQVSATTGHGLLRAQSVCPDQVPIRTIPLRAGFTATNLVPNAVGIVGAHRSLRTGEGVDLAGVRAFAPGDRLNRINWAVSMRTRQLHVTTTYSDRDTEVVLVMDTSVEVGHSAAGAGSASTIDVAVRAATSIAEHYLRNGDRVGLLDLSRPGRPVRSRSGRAELDRIIDILLEVRGGQLPEQSATRALARISSRALVIVLSPLLSDGLAAAVAGLSRTGRSVVVIDTLPEQVWLAERGQWTELAWRIQLLNRQNLASALAEHGVPVVAWRGSGSLDQVLIGLSRVGAAPRVLR